MSLPATSMPACSAMLECYRTVRQQTADLVAPLSEADCQVQSMPDTKIGRAHV